MDIPTLASAAWTALAALLPLIASKGAEKLGEEAGGTLWTVVKEKFEKEPATQKVTEKLLAAPENEKMQAVFQYQLEEALEEDAKFAKTLASLLEKAGKSYQANVDGDGVVVQGDHSVGVAKGGVYIGGKAENNTIVQGNNNKIEK